MDAHCHKNEIVPLDILDVVGEGVSLVSLVAYVVLGLLEDSLNLVQQYECSCTKNLQKETYDFHC